MFRYLSWFHLHIPIYSKNCARKEIKILVKSNLRNSVFPYYVLFEMLLVAILSTNELLDSTLTYLYKNNSLKYISFIVKVRMLFINCLHSFSCLFIFLRSYARFCVLIRKKTCAKILSNSKHFSFTVLRTICFTMECFPITISAESFTGSSESYQWWVA